VGGKGEGRVGRINRMKGWENKGERGRVVCGIGEARMKELRTGLRTGVGAGMMRVEKVVGVEVGGVGGEGRRREGEGNKEETFEGERG